MNSIPGQDTKIPHAVGHGEKVNKSERLIEEKETNFNLCAQRSYEMGHKKTPKQAIFFTKKQYICVELMGKRNLDLGA